MRGLLLQCKNDTSKPFIKDKQYPAIKGDDEMCQIYLGKNRKRITYHYDELGKMFYVYDDNYEVDEKLFNIKKPIHRIEQRYNGPSRIMYVIQNDKKEYYSTSQSWDSDFNKAYMFKTEKSATTKKSTLEECCELKEIVITLK